MAAPPRLAQLCTFTTCRRHTHVQTNARQGQHRAQQLEYGATGRSAPIACPQAVARRQQRYPMPALPRDHPRQPDRFPSTDRRIWRRWGALPTRLDNARLRRLTIELTSFYWSNPASDSFSLSSPLLSSLAEGVGREHVLCSRDE
jgi:hypothetical protein